MSPPPHYFNTETAPSLCPSAATFCRSFAVLRAGAGTMGFSAGPARDRDSGTERETCEREREREIARKKRVNERMRQRGGSPRERM